MNKQTKTFKQTMMRAMLKTIVFTWAAGMGLMAMASMDSDVAVGDVMDNRPTAPGSPAALVEANDCWTGNPPADMVGKVPGHVVIRFEGDVAARYAGSKAVGIALAQLFENTGTNHEIHGFCR